MQAGASRSPQRRSLSSRLAASAEKARASGPAPGSAFSAEPCFDHLPQVPPYDQLSIDHPRSISVELCYSIFGLRRALPSSVLVSSVWCRYRLGVAFFFFFFRVESYESQILQFSNFRINSSNKRGDINKYYISLLTIRSYITDFFEHATGVFFFLFCSHSETLQLLNIYSYDHENIRVIARKQLVSSYLSYFNNLRILVGDGFIVCTNS